MNAGQQNHHVSGVQEVHVVFQFSYGFDRLTRVTVVMSIVGILAPQTPSAWKVVVGMNWRGGVEHLQPV